MAKKTLNSSRVRKNKKVLKGVEYYRNEQTGELIPFALQEIEDRDFNFHKMWLTNVVTALQDITNKKMELAFWIIEHLDRENKLIATFRQIKEETGFSMRTVNETFAALQKGECPFLVKMQSGAYMVNPNVLYKGSHTSRMGIVFKYSNAVVEANKKKAKKEKAKSVSKKK